jgi:hypothetical protein
VVGLLLTVRERGRNVPRRAKVSGQRFTGSIVADPLRSLPAGTRIGFQSVRVSPLAIGTHKAASLDQMAGVLLSIHFKTDDRHTAQGSAVIVAPGIAVTAQHVIEPFLPAIMAGDTQVAAFGIGAAGIMMWQVKKILTDPGHDIAILSLEYGSPMPPGNRFRQAHLTTRMPCLGEPVMIVGFRPTADDFGDARETTTYSGDVLMGVGQVTAIHERGRDRAMLPWPVLEIDCPARGSMSGGPAFDKDGHLVGVLCSSWETDEDQGPSYVSLLFPALGFRFEVAWLNEVLGSHTSLIEIDPNCCQIEERDAISFEEDGDGNLRTTYTYTYASRL